MELKTIQDLLDYKFKVPSYQRGYRWEEMHVEALLNDILEFSQKPDKQNNEFYCLQPLMLKAINVENSIDISEIQKEANENKIEYEKLQNLINQRPKAEFSVIDGQQRLTTIYLILKHLIDRKPFELTYEINNRENIFEDHEFKEKCKNNEIDDSSADKFYISTAVKTIKEWLGEDNKEKFKKTLLEKVKVIWYELKENDDEKQTFENVNSGKIPLTNAELIKATLINSRDNEKDKIELAKEWDEIEYYLQNDEVWGFLTTAEAYPTRIELIFEICLNQKHNDSDKYETFNTLKEAVEPNNTNEKEKNKKKNSKEKITYKSYDEFWQEVKKTFLTLRYWYEDYEIYHLVGFLVSAKLKIEDIYYEFKDKTKTKFRKGLKGKICKSMNKDFKEKGFNEWLNNLKNKFNELKENKDENNKKEIKEKIYEDIINDKSLNLNYDDDYPQVTKILLLFNIATILNSKSQYTRFSFDKFNKEKWSLEHIHAQNVEDIRGYEKQKVFLDDAKRNLTNQAIRSTFSEEELEKAKKLSKEIDDFMNSSEDTQIKDEEFKNLYNEIVKLFGGLENKDNISNLALLSANLNAELNNAIFPSKQEKIKEMDERGEFIPICTKNAFMKYYSDSANNRFIWNINDALSYHQSIIKTLDKFFGEEK